MILRPQEGQLFLAISKREVKVGLLGCIENWVMVCGTIDISPKIFSPLDGERKWKLTKPGQQRLLTACIDKGIATVIYRWEPAQGRRRRGKETLWV